MLNELKLSQENVKVRIDTVYIETKRNFWGKEKTTTSVKSDSTITSTIDSVLEKTEKIDTISSAFITLSSSLIVTNTGFEKLLFSNSSCTLCRDL